MTYDDESSTIPRMEEKPENEISIWWKVSHIACCLVIFVSSVITVAIFSTLQYDFHDTCILFSYPVVVATVNNTIDISINKSRWGPSGNCDFIVFASVISSIISFTFFSLFVMCGRGGRSTSHGFGLSAPWRIMVPSLIASVFTGLATLVASTYITLGFGTFCESIVKTSNITSCSDTTNMKWKDYPELIFFYNSLQGVEVTAWVMSLTWLLSGSILALRCVKYVDFQPVNRSKYGGSVGDDSTLDTRSIQGESDI